MQLSSFVTDLVKLGSIWTRLVDVLTSTFHQNHITQLTLRTYPDKTVDVVAEYWQPGGVLGSTEAGTSSVVLLYNGPPVGHGLAEFIGDQVLNPRTDALKRLAPRVEYVSDWESVPTALKMLPPGSVFVVGGTDDDLHPWAPNGDQEMTAESILAIQEWVRQGGRYLGICGGAIVAQEIYDDGPGPDTYQFPALNIAPVIANNFVGDDALERVENIVLANGQVVGMYFQMGSYMELVPTSNEYYEVVGTYQAMVTPIPHPSAIAAALFTYGNGKVLISGFHLEATEDYWDGTPPPDYVAHSELLEKALVGLISPARPNSNPSGNSPPSVVPANTRGFNSWTVDPDKFTLDYWNEYTLESGGGNFPVSHGEADQVPYVKTYDCTRQTLDTIRFVMTRSGVFDVALTKSITITGATGFPTGYAIKVVSQGKTYKFIPMDKSGHRANWEDATHYRVTCEQSNLDSKRVIPERKMIG